MKLINADGTSEKIWSLGLGKDKVEFRTEKGVLYFRNSGEGWERVTSPSKISQVKPKTWTPGLKITSGEIVTFNENLFFATITHTSSSSFSENASKFVKIAELDLLTKVNVGVDVSPKVLSSVNSSTVFIEGGSTSGSFEIVLPQETELRLGERYFFKNESTFIIDIQNSNNESITKALPGSTVSFTLKDKTVSGGVFELFEIDLDSENSIRIIEANTFSRGEIVTLSDAGWTLAVPTGTARNKVGIISQATVNFFDVKLIGTVDLTGTSLVPLTPNAIYYLHQSTPGAVTTEKSIPGEPVFVALDANKVLVLPFASEGIEKFPGEITREALNFSDSDYKYLTQTKFSIDKTELIDLTNTTAEYKGDKFKFTSGEKIRTKNTINDLFLSEPSQIDRVSVFSRWATGADELSDDISKVRVSKDGGLHWTESYIKKNGFTAAAAAELTVDLQGAVDNSIELNKTSATKLLQKFSSTTSIEATSALLKLKRIGAVYGKYRFIFYSNANGQPDKLISYSDWYEMNKLTTAFSDVLVSFDVPFVIKKNEDVFVGIEVQNTTEYNFTQTGNIKNITVGLNSNGGGTGKLFTYDGSWNESTALDLSVGVYGKKILQSSISDASSGDIYINGNKEREFTFLKYFESDVEKPINNTSAKKISQEFYTTEDILITSVAIKLKRLGTPGGQILLSIYSDDGADAPFDLLFQSDNRININSISTIAENKTFNFQLASLQKNKKYHFVLSCDSDYNYLLDTNAVRVMVDESTPVYVFSKMNYFDGSIWTAAVSSSAISFSVNAVSTNNDTLELYDFSNYEAFKTISPTGNKQVAQKIILKADSFIEDISVYLNKTSTPTGNVFIEIRDNQSGLPGDVLYTSDSISVETLTPSVFSKTKLNFQERFFLAKNTTYWISINTENLAGGDILVGYGNLKTTTNQCAVESAGSVWSLEQAAVCYIINGIQSELIFEIIPRKEQVELTDLAIAFGFDYSNIGRSGRTNTVALSSLMKDTGSVAHGLNVSTDKGSLIAVLDKTAIYIGGEDFIITPNTAEFGSINLQTFSTAVFMKNEIYNTFAEAFIQSNDNIRKLSEPKVSLIDNETISISGSGGSAGFKIELMGGPVFCQDDTRVSFDSLKNKFNGLGLDTGAKEASTVYYIYGVQSNGIYGGIVLSKTSPEAGGPTGFSYWKYIDKVWNDENFYFVYPYRDSLELRSFSGLVAATNIALYNWNSSKGEALTHDNVNGTITVNKSGVLNITARQYDDAQSGVFGITKNGTDLASLVELIPPAEILVYTESKNLTAVIEVASGDILRIHLGANSGVAESTPNLTFVKILFENT